MDKLNDVADAPLDPSLIKGVDADHGGVARCGEPITRGVIIRPAPETQDKEDHNVPS